MRAGPPSAFRTHLAIDLSYLAAVLICWSFYRAESQHLPRSRAAALVLLVFLVSSFVNHIHRFSVDQASNYAPPLSNEMLQEHLQTQVIELSPGMIPHSYRFLPNGLVYWLQIAGVRFDSARDIYRLLVGLVLFYAIYRYARLYVGLIGAVICLLLVAVVCPITFEWYVGQLTDPLSHLSFVLAFLFLETGNFPGLLTTLLLGSLAKETILALCGFYVLFCRKQPQYARKAALLCGAGLTLYVAVRLFVLHGPLHYQQISGPGLEHVVENWRDTKWCELFVITAGAYLPFLVLAWRDTPRILKQLVLYLTPVLFVSSLFFSWLSETRNWMPVVIVSAVITARYWTDRSDRLPGT